MTIKQNHIFVKVLFFTLVFSSCSKTKDQVGISNLRFTSEIVESSNYPISIMFKSNVPSTDKLEWRFSDGRKSNELSPLMTFTYSGNVNVTLIQITGNQIDSTTKTITVPNRQFSVSVVYLIPRDVKYGKEFIDSLDVSVRVVQSWFNQQLEGKSFRIDTPMIDTIQSKFYKADFITSSDLLMNQIQGEVYSRLYGKISNEKNVVLVFLPVNTPGFNGVGGQSNGKNTAIVGGGAFDGLSGNDLYKKNVGLWTTAHELGHAFGLSHNSIPEALMLGYDANGYFPPNAGIPKFLNCIVLKSEKLHLLNSPFIF